MIKRVLLSDCDIELITDSIEYYLKRNGKAMSKKNFEKLIKLLKLDLMLKQQLKLKGE